MRGLRGGCMLIAICAALAGCEREIRPFQEIEVASASSQKPMLTPLYAGPQRPPTPENSPFQENAYGIAEGKRLFSAFNCVGCHANGGGGMGPPLMDDEWIYGYYPDQIFRTILEGRPNGMPAFRGRIPDYQVWSIAAYVRSMSGLVPKDAAPGRDDHLSGKKPENSTDKMQPSNSSPPAVP